MKRYFNPLLAGVGLAALSALPAQAQLKTDFAAASFAPGIVGDYDSLQDLAKKMVANTRLVAASSGGEKMILVVGVLDMEGGGIIYGALSEPIVVNSGKSGLIEVGSGPLDVAWEAFEDPLFGFEDPIFGFEDPIFGFEDPIFGFEDPIFGFEDPLFGSEAPPSFKAIWGTNGTAYEPDTSAAYKIGAGSIDAPNPEYLLNGIWGVGGASYEGPADLLLVVAPLSLDANTEVSYSAALLPFSAVRE